MNEWENSRSQRKRHTHTPIEDAKGQMVCSSCSKIIIKPIKSSDDPRLVEAGFMRSGHHDDDDDLEEFEPIPLPEMLITLHEKGAEFGFKPAPPAPYVVAVMHSGDNIRDDDLWDRLAHKS